MKPPASELASIRQLIEIGELDKAWARVDPLLERDAEQPECMWLASLILERSKKLTVAYHISRRLVELRPNKFPAWIALGRVCDQLWRIDESEHAYRRAFKEAKDNKERALSLVNLAALYISIGQFAAAHPLLLEAGTLDPESKLYRANLGFCQLAMRDWEAGWRNYAYSLGTETRKKLQYGDEPLWDGTPGNTVAVYGEQGIGDEMAFASMIPDAIPNVGRLVVDCDPRLANLFTRSFPQAHVYGGRGKKSMALRVAEDRPEYSLPFGGLGQFYRNSDEAFPGTPYLVPDPDRVLMWRSLFKHKAKPVIGIAWSGGVKHTGERFRRWELRDMLPFFEAVDAHWVCLQHKDAAEEIAQFRALYPEVDLVQYPHATLTPDYDDTAALVAALDHVVCIQTAIAHLSGGLGKPCWVFVAKSSQWRYGESGDSIPWYASLKVYRQRTLGSWEQEILQGAEDLKALHGRHVALSEADDLGRTLKPRAPLVMVH